LASVVFQIEFDNDCSVVWVSEIDLIRQFTERIASESKLFAKYGDSATDLGDPLDNGCRVLVIDDMGLSTDAYAARIVGEILDRRNRNDLATVVTTNATKAELRAWLGERCYSRLMHRCLWIAVTGPDYRLAGSE
jgi:DNA replication protein DnaC